MPVVLLLPLEEYTLVSQWVIWKFKVKELSNIMDLFIVSGIIVILALHLFTPYFVYIPKASLAAVIIAAVVFMVEFHVVKPMWRSKSKFNLYNQKVFEFLYINQ